MDDLPSVPLPKPIVIGLYGISGSGKTFLLEQLRDVLGNEGFAFFGGSEVIASVVQGGLETFRGLPEQDRVEARRRAIRSIFEECERSQRTGLVTGHLSFWQDSSPEPAPVYTDDDLDVFTHILYLRTSPSDIVDRCARDTVRCRRPMTVQDMTTWQAWEVGRLRTLCMPKERDILFMPLRPHQLAPQEVAKVVTDFAEHDEPLNTARAIEAADRIVNRLNGLETVLLVDADKTLTEQDAGLEYWRQHTGDAATGPSEHRLRQIFTDPTPYSYDAFRRATLLYEESASDEVFHALCTEVAHGIILYPQMLALLRIARDHEHVGAIIITSGLGLVWRMVIASEGLSEHVGVIGGGRLSDGLVVTPSTKAAVAAHLREHHRLYVWAFGDSPVDLDMLCTADQSVVVVGDERTRSRSMDRLLALAIANRGLRARQAVMSTGAWPRLDADRLPLVDLSAPAWHEAVVCRRIGAHVPGLLHATDRASARLLMSSTRDANVAGPALRDAHGKVGWYVAVEYLLDVLGTEDYPIPHVQGHRITGTRLRYEQGTTIVALMRGGEPMAFGVSAALPQAMFVHAKEPSDVLPHHVESARNILLVDSVVNSGEIVYAWSDSVAMQTASVGACCA